MNLNIYVLNTYDYVPDMTNCMYRLYLRKTGRHEVDYLLTSILNFILEHMVIGHYYSFLSQSAMAGS